jgi:hypothetical protein
MNKNIFISHSPVRIHDVGRLARRGLILYLQYTRLTNCAAPLTVTVGVNLPMFLLTGTS